MIVKCRRQQALAHMLRHKARDSVDLLLAMCAAAVVALVAFPVYAAIPTENLPVPTQHKQHHDL